jgi:hypothetical protein
MTKDSRRSSTAGPAAPLPQDNDTEGAPADPEKPSEMEDAGDAPKNDDQNETSVESQPTAAASASEANGSAAGFPTYGTRSRNRTGGARINYAEDKELDVDFEVTSSKDNAGRKNNKSTDSTGAGEATSTTNNSRRATTNDSEGTSLQNGHKDSSPAATSLAASNGTPQPASKKRKIAGQPPVASSTASQAQTPLSVTPAPQVPSSKAYPAPQLVPGFRESNMLGFERCGGRLKHKVLVADDGTRLQVNGRTNTHI